MCKSTALLHQTIQQDPVTKSLADRDTRTGRRQEVTKKVAIVFIDALKSVIFRKGRGGP